MHGFPVLHCIGVGKHCCTPCRRQHADYDYDYDYDYECDYDYESDYDYDYEYEQPGQHQRCADAGGGELHRRHRSST
ncbi:hypothetical protein [Streptomyces sp. NPDC048650]|uniref:hypothetical protein n=1 Tax=Streptomyces sp. NPDC048650 TaxID=3365583 RepID=UPI0037170938